MNTTAVIAFAAAALMAGSALAAGVTDVDYLRASRCKGLADTVGAGSVDAGATWAGARDGRNVTTLLLTGRSGVVAASTTGWMAAGISGRASAAINRGS